MRNGYLLNYLLELKHLKILVSRKYLGIFFKQSLPLYIFHHGRLRVKAKITFFHPKLRYGLALIKSSHK